MKYNITKLTTKSNENINTIFENYSDYMNYEIKNTYFIKLLYTLLDRAENENKQDYTIHKKLEMLDIQSSYISPEITQFIKNTRFHSYKTQIIIKDIIHNIHFYSITEIDIDIEKYLYFIKIILNICSQSQINKSNKIFTFKIVLSDFKKEYPCIPVETSTINSGVTDPNKNEVIIFRKEEWLKVFIHECFHLFCLDFCNIEFNFIKLFKPLFNIESEFLFFETLTEFWARTINIAVISYFTKKNIMYEEFESLMKINIQVERLFCICQMNQILGKMGFTYESLMDKNRTIVYKENTNFFCYYVLTSVLFFHYEQTMAWFIEHNETLLQFSKNKKSVFLFFQFIKQVYRNPIFLSLIENIDTPLHNCNMSAFEISI